MPHTYTSLTVHVVFSTKNRVPQIDADLEQRLFPYAGGIIRELGGKLFIANGGVEHLHLLASVPATLSVAELTGKVKGCSSKWIHETFPGRSTFAWQRGYAAFTVSQSQISRVARYIENQKVHHAKTSFRDEFIELLRLHGVSPDDRFLWS